MKTLWSCVLAMLMLAAQTVVAATLAIAPVAILRRLRAGRSLTAGALPLPRR
jgi:hypothetical protein